MQDFKSYYHECFLRGRPELSVLIQRLITPGKKVPDIEGEPDFYEISRLYPLPAPPSDDASQVPSSDGASQERDARIVSLSPHHHSQPTSQAGSGAPTSQAGSGASCPQSHHAQPHSTLNGHHAQRTSQAGSGAPTIQAGSGASFPRAQSVTRHSGYCRPPRLLHTVSLLEPGQPYPTQMLQQTYLLNQVRPPLCPPNQSSYGYHLHPHMAMVQECDPQPMVEGYSPQSFVQPTRSLEDALKSILYSGTGNECPDPFRHKFPLGTRVTNFFQRYGIFKGRVTDTWIDPEKRELMYLVLYEPRVKEAMNEETLAQIVDT